MADKPINLAPTETTDLASLYGRDDNVDNRLVQYPANQFAHAVGFTASDKGRIPYINASGDYTSLAASTDGYNLTLSGGVPVWAVNPSSHRYITSATASGATSVDFTSGFSTDYDEYMFLLIGVYPSTAGSHIDMRVSIDGGSSFIATGYDYGTNGVAGGATAATQSLSASEIQLTNSTGPNNTLAASAAGKANLILSTTRASVNSILEYRNATPNKAVIVAGGSLTTASRVNGARFLASAGNINGTIRMYGVKNS